VAEFVYEIPRLGDLGQGNKNVNMMAETTSHKTNMRVPRKQPVQTKAQLRHAFTKFSLLHESIETDYRHEIDVIT
jgi:hypothetical protein